MSKRILENGSVSSCPCITCFGRQYGVAARTPCTVAVYKSARLPPIPSPSPRDWVCYYAGLDSNIDFLASLWCYFWGFAPW